MPVGRAPGLLAAPLRARRQWALRQKEGAWLHLGVVRFGLKELWALSRFGFSMGLYNLPTLCVYTYVYIYIYLSLSLLYIYIYIYVYIQYLHTYIHTYMRIYGTFFVETFVQTFTVPRKRRQVQRFSPDWDVSNSKEAKGFCLEHWVSGFGLGVQGTSLLEGS